MDANLYFANVSTFQDLLLDLDVNDPALRAIVVDMYPVNQIDSTATHALHEIIETCRRNGVELYMAGVKGPVKDVLDAAGLSEELGEDRFFLEVHDAAEAAEKEVEQLEETASGEPVSTSS
jgi:SulP family sulfate permease